MSNTGRDEIDERSSVIFVGTDFGVEDRRHVACAVKNADDVDAIVVGDAVENEVLLVPLNCPLPKRVGLR
ncbi:MAG: hypothetical protein V3V08_23705 [Nannocystaceae bacterium]